VLAADAVLTVNAASHKVEWDTRDGATGQVFVSVNNGPEQLVAEGAQGSVEAAWISSTDRYAFTLYAGRAHDHLLASATLGPPTGLAPPQSSVLSKVADRLLALHIVPVVLIALALLSSGRAARAVAVGAVIWALVPVLTSLPTPLEQQPFPDSAEYADAAYQVAHGNGYVTYVHGNGPEPPRYPPGFSLALTPFAALGDYPANVGMGERTFAVLYVVVTAAVAWGMAGPRASALTTVLIGSSPFAIVASRLVLSDALAASLTVPLLLLVRCAGTRRAALAGGLASLLVTIRLSAGLALPALLLAVPARTRWALLAAAAPLLLALGLFQWHTFGSPFRTGYDYWLPGARNFDLANATASPPFGDGPWVVPDRLDGSLLQWICPCPTGGPQATAPDVLLYPAVLLGLFWTFTPPLVTLVGLAYLWSRRQVPGSRFTLAFVALSLAFYCVYFYQGTRFMAAPATLLAIYSGVGLAHWTRGLASAALASPRPLRALVRPGRKTSRSASPLAGSIAPP
jgi:hypothetical protein